MKLISASPGHTDLGGPLATARGANPTRREGVVVIPGGGRLGFGKLRDRAWGGGPGSTWRRRENTSRRCHQLNIKDQRMCELGRERAQTRRARPRGSGWESSHRAGPGGQMNVPR